MCDSFRTWASVRAARLSIERIHSATTSRTIANGLRTSIRQIFSAHWVKGRTPEEIEAIEKEAREVFEGEFAAVGGY